MTALGPILVTGASGCVGRAVTARLLSEGYEVRAVRRRASQPPSPLNQRPNLTWIDADLLYADIETIVRDCGAVIHLAALVHSPNIRDAADYFAQNVKVTRDLFRAARGSGIPPERFIFASTTAVYGFDSGFHADELTPTRPLTQYGQSKQQAEQAVLNGGGMVLRLPIVYGPGDRGNMARLITAIGRGRFLLPRGATQPRSMLASANAAEGFLQAMRHPTAAGIFLLTDCDDWSIRDITECVWAAFRTAGRSVSKPRTIPDSVLSAVAAVGTVMESLGLPPPISLASLRKLTTPLTFSCKKSATVLSYRPAVDVGTALALATEAVTC